MFDVQAFGDSGLSLVSIFLVLFFNLVISMSQYFDVSFVHFSYVGVCNLTNIGNKFFYWFFDRYASIKAIESKSHVDDKQWLTYWVLYSMITLFELTFAKAIEW